MNSIFSPNWLLQLIKQVMKMINTIFHKLHISRLHILKLLVRPLAAASSVALILTWLTLNPKSDLASFSRSSGTGHRVQILTQVQAQIETTNLPTSQSPTPNPATATDSAQQATASAQTTQEASPAAQVEKKIQEKQAEDITETSGEQKSKLAAFLDENPVKPLTWHNFMQHAIREAVNKGLPANIIVLLLLFPLIASLIAASRHIVGLKGFGIYIPAVLSVAFVSTEIITGVIIFVAVILAAIITRKIVRRLRFPYLPRTAMILWGVSIFILALMVLSSRLGLHELLTINIFPILIIILLTENFMDSQLFNSQQEALKITLETLFIAIICSLIISQEAVHKFVLLYPEISLLGTVIINYLIGRYTGLRLLEFARFNSVLTQERYNYPIRDDQSE
jgi:hypothetical protein